MPVLLLLIGAQLLNLKQTLESIKNKLTQTFLQCIIYLVLKKATVLWRCSSAG